MTIAILSDIHGNLEALEAVLAAAAERNVDQTYCLGDITTYGPNPLECLDRVMEFPVCVLGDHDQALLFDPDGCKPFAVDAILWARRQMELSAQNRHWDFLGELPRAHQDRNAIYVHGSPREPTHEKVYPEDVYNPRKMEALFSRFEHICFQGHTHVPGVFSADGLFISPDECDYVYRLSDDKAMINVGSVGQPRDADPRACYVVFDDDTIEFHRVEYSIETTADKIRSNPELNSRLGERLYQGR